MPKERESPQRTPVPSDPRPSFSVNCLGKGGTRLGSPFITSLDVDGVDAAAHRSRAPHSSLSCHICPSPPSPPDPLPAPPRQHPLSLSSSSTAMQFTAVPKSRDAELLRNPVECAPQAMRYLSYALYPLVGCYSIYSLIYKTHKSWYSWIVNSLVGAVYMFGFILMCPQWVPCPDRPPDPRTRWQ